MNQNSMLWRKPNTFFGNSYDKDNLALRKCPVCDSAQSTVLLAIDDFQYFTDSNTDSKRVDVRQVQCSNCYAIFMNPCVTELGFQTLFREAGQSYGATDGRSAEQISWLQDRKLIDSSTTVLDIGCFEGSFLSVLPDCKLKIGVDVDSHAIEMAIKQHGGDRTIFINTRFEHLEVPNQPDLVTMLHVLEHLPNPYDVLLKIRTLSHQSTKLVIEVPIIENGYTNDINGFLSAQHFTHFSLASLTNLLARAGFGIIETDYIKGYNGCRIIAMLNQGQSRQLRPTTDYTLGFSYLSHWYDNLVFINRKIEAVKSNRILIWGGGFHTEFLYHFTQLFKGMNERQFIIVDSDPIKQGKTWRGIRIEGPEILCKLNWDGANLLVSSYGNQNEICAQASILGAPFEKLIKIYDEINIY